MTLDHIRLHDIHARVEKASQQGRIFAITESGPVSFESVVTMSRVFADAFGQQSLIQKKRVGLAGNLGAGTMAALWLAAVRHGLTCLFLSPPATFEDAQDLCLKNCLDLMYLANGSDACTVIGPHGAIFLPLRNDPATPSDMNDTATMVFFTSGSTGKAKGVRLGGDGLARHLELYTRLFGYDRDGAVLMNGLPLHHTDGSFHGMMMALWSGATWLRPNGFTVQNSVKWAELAQQHRATHLIANPTLLTMLLGAFPEGQPINFGPLGMIISSAEVLQPDLWQVCQDRFGVPVTNIYGMTETTNGGLFALPSDAPTSFGTVGRAHDIDFEIREPSGKAAAQGEAGRLFLRGKSLFQGYEQNGRLIYQHTDEAWFDTCDLAVQDGGGNLSILGRLDRSINFAGYLINPAEVAAAVTTLNLFAHVRVEILEDSDGKSVPVAFVCGAGPQGWARRDDALIHQLPIEQRPRHVVELPNTSSAALCALSLADCARLLAQHRAKHAQSADGRNDGIDQVVLAIAARAFRCTPAQIGLHSSQDMTSGWDSFAFVELVLETEIALGVTFSADDLAHIHTLNDMVMRATNRVQALIKATVAV